MSFPNGQQNNDTISTSALTQRLAAANKRMHTAHSNQTQSTHVNSGGGAAASHPGCLGAALDQQGCASVEHLEEDACRGGLTWNGDDNWAHLGTDTMSKIMALCNKLISTSIREACKLKTKVPKGGKRPKQAKKSSNPLKNIPQATRDLWNELYRNMRTQISSENPRDQAFYWNVVFRMVFFKRAIVKEGRAKIGCGERVVSYWLMRRLIEDFPKTATQLVQLFPHFGYYGDIDHLIAVGIALNNTEFVTACINVYVNALNNDIKLILGKSLQEMTDSEKRTIIKEKLDEVRAMSAEARDSVYKKYEGQLSCAGKFLKRNDSFNSSHRPLIVAHIFHGDSPDPLDSFMSHPTGDRHVNFCDMILRWTGAFLNEVLKVTEVYMSSDRWSMITNPTAGAMHQHRLGLLNEIKGEPVPAHLVDKGNRTTNPDRIALRQRILQQAADGKLAGAGMDICKLANVIWDVCKDGYSFKESNASHALRTTVHSQYLDIEKDLNTSLTKIYTEMIQNWEEGGSVGPRPTDPRYAIATVDMSGSMASANVMHYAMLLGILITRLSTLSDTFMTFSSEPRFITLRKEGDLFSWMTSMMHNDWGMSTDIDRANNLLLSRLKKHPHQQLRHIIISDMNWNQATSSGYGCKQRGPTEVERTKAKYTSANVPFPLTIYWNMNCNSPGFPVNSKTTGTMLVEGVNQGLVNSVLAGDYKTTVDPKTGAVVVDVNPLDKFIENMTHHDFDCVSDIVYQTAEGPFSTSEAQTYVQLMIEHKQK
uniref:DUF7788 domain-containing protein n=1 Tax=Megaviridae environmental sample TaxID=1737588 RepID=A0A5J6VKT7_9VIRU|nr:MAG: protein of unknown function DUF2828 [Megaviridae environmental sample]